MKHGNRTGLRKAPVEVHPAVPGIFDAEAWAAILNAGLQGFSASARQFPSCGILRRLWQIPSPSARVGGDLKPLSLWINDGSGRSSFSSSDYEIKREVSTVCSPRRAGGASIAGAIAACWSPRYLCRLHSARTEYAVGNPDGDEIAFAIGILSLRGNARHFL